MDKDMRRLTSSVSGILALALLHAQPTILITSAPAPGFTAPVNELFGLPLWESGPDRIWDFSTAVVTNTRQLQLAQPSFAPGASNFPFATVVAFADNMPPYTYSRVTNGQLRTVGVMTTAPRVYSDPLVTMVFPCTYNTTWTDSYAFPGEQGTRTYIADGYGTLIGPAGSLSDVLKVRSEYASLDTVVQGIAYTGLMVEDVFWRSGTPWPVANSYWNRVYAGGQLIEELRVGAAIAEIPASIEEVEDARTLHAWPNPTDGAVSLSLGGPGLWTISCTDALGREVMAVVVQGSATSPVELDLGRSAPGRYVLRAQHEQGAVFRAAVLRE
jgi:hypothetical protein